jgi:histidinol-phosphatase
MGPSRDDVEFAHELATTATRIALSYFDADVRYETKSDGSPVSDADLAVERALVELVQSRRPDDGILTEESGVISTGERRWIFDPIDGTSYFIKGDSLWGTHVALEVGGEVVLGIITRPVDGQRWWAAVGGGAYAGGDADPMATTEPLLVSDVGALDAARVGFFSLPDSTVPAAVGAHVGAVHLHGDFIGYLLSARLDAVVCGPGCGYVWDHAPCVIVVEEAGGRFTDPRGGRRLDLRGGIYSNTLVHEQLVAIAPPLS